MLAICFASTAQLAVRMLALRPCTICCFVCTLLHRIVELQNALSCPRTARTEIWRSKATRALINAGSRREALFSAAKASASLADPVPAPCRHSPTGASSGSPVPHDSSSASRRRQLVAHVRDRAMGMPSPRKKFFSHEVVLCHGERLAGGLHGRPTPASSYAADRDILEFEGDHLAGSRRSALSASWSSSSPTGGRLDRRRRKFASSAIDMRLEPSRAAASASMRPKLTAAQ